VFEHKDFPSPGYKIVLSNPLDHSDASPLYPLPSQSLEYYLDEPINNFLIYDANIDLVYDKNMFNMLGGNVMCLCIRTFLAQVRIGKDWE